MLWICGAKMPTVKVIQSVSCFPVSHIFLQADVRLLHSVDAGRQCLNSVLGRVCELRECCYDTGMSYFIEYHKN